MSLLWQDVGGNYFIFLCLFSYFFVKYVYFSLVGSLAFGPLSQREKKSYITNCVE